MAGAGSAYNLHMKTTQNKVKIGNYVEERALIETAPTACVPSWSDVDANGKPVRWSNKMQKPDHHDTKLLVAPCWEPDEYTTCTRDDFVQVATHKERKIGVREELYAQRMMEAARNPPPAPAPPLNFTSEAQEAYDREAVGTNPEIAPEDSLAARPPITVYTTNGKHSVAPDGNFGKNCDFSTPAERYTKDVMK